jgi:hypothetical protein
MTSLLQFDSPPPKPQRQPVSTAAIDTALTAQIIVAWAGESGEQKRLGWWRTDLVSEFGGEDLFRRLLPGTWEWAVLQGVREAARRRDAELRRQDHDPDRIISLFHLGFELDERIQERFSDLKRADRDPQKALPGLAMIRKGYDRDHFERWLQNAGHASATVTPIGRHVRGLVPADLPTLVNALLAALAPLPDHYPLPHFRVTP